MKFRAPVLSTIQFNKLGLDWKDSSMENYIEKDSQENWNFCRCIDFHDRWIVSLETKTPKTIGTP